MTIEFMPSAEAEKMQDGIHNLSPIEQFNYVTFLKLRKDLAVAMRMEELERSSGKPLTKREVAFLDHCIERLINLMTIVSASEKLRGFIAFEWLKLERLKKYGEFTSDTRDKFLKYMDFSLDAM